MLKSVFATKIGMTQAWTQSGKRLPITKCKAELHRVVELRDERVRDKTTLTPELITIKQATIGYGTRPLKRMTKPLQGNLTKQGFSDGVKKMVTVRFDEGADTDSLKAGETIALSSELAVGDLVQVQGTSKGHGYAGVVKRHGFHGGPATHGQSDRERAPGSIGQRTTPGRVFKNHRMAGHYGVEAKTVTGLVVMRIDDATGEIWLSGPVPGSVSSMVKITKMGGKKDVKLFAVEETEVKKEVEVTKNAEVPEVTEAVAETVDVETVVAQEVPTDAPQS